MWHDPAGHARDFAERYAEPLNYHVENRMMELGIDPLKIARKLWKDTRANTDQDRPNLSVQAARTGRSSNSDDVDSKAS